MKIQDLFESIRIVLTNEEQDFVKTYGREVFLSSVRKGMYEISNDNKQLVKAKNVFYNRSSIRQT